MKRAGNKYSKGQTLIETIVAIAILTTGIIGGLALAINSLSSSDRVTKEIIATNLAREGVETVRHVRDSNWLDDDLEDCGYIDNGQECVPEWANFGGGFLGICNLIISEVNIFTGTSICRNYRAEFNPSNGSLTLDNRGSFSASEYVLYLHPTGVYNHSSSGGQATNFYRIVKIFRDESAPFDSDNFRIRVESTAWWQGRGCANVVNENIVTNCKVVVEEFLTNWKDY